MNRVIISCTIKFVLDFTPNYCWILDNKCYNIKTGRFIKQILNNGSIGYIINGKFISLNELRRHIKKIK
jgi:hypothetical protein